MEESKRSMTLTISWVLLLILGLLLAVAGVAALLTAYVGSDDPIVAGVGLETLARVHPDLPGVIRGRRATAAALSISNGILLCWIALTAFRRAEKWAWFAVMAAMGIGGVLSIIRIPVLGVTAGADTAAGALGIALLALLISYRDFR